MEGRFDLTKDKELRCLVKDLIHSQVKAIVREEYAAIIRAEATRILVNSSSYVKAKHTESAIHSAVSELVNTTLATDIATEVQKQATNLTDAVITETLKKEALLAVKVNLLDNITDVISKEFRRKELVVSLRSK